MDKTKLRSLAERNVVTLKLCCSECGSIALPLAIAAFVSTGRLWSALFLQFRSSRLGTLTDAESFLFVCNISK